MLLLNSILFVLMSSLLIDYNTAFPVNNNYPNGPPPNNSMAQTENYNNDANDYPSETQSAQCTITSGDIKASAQATITKTLEGVCGTNDMITAFQTLEARLMRELYNIRLMLGNQEYQRFPLNQQFLYQPVFQPILPPPKPRSFLQNPNNNNINYQHADVPQAQTTPASQSLFDKPNPGVQTIPSNQAQVQQPSVPLTSTTAKPRNSADTEDAHYLDNVDDDNDEDEDLDNDEDSLDMGAGAGDEKLQNISNQFAKKTLKLKSLEFKPITKKEKQPIVNKTGSRDYEIHKLNNTVMNTGESKIFTYFWKIENYTKKLQTHNLTTISSPIFTVSGLNLRIRATLNHLNRDYLNLQLEKVTKEILAKSKSNVILETGNMFKAIEPRKLFRHKIIIMNQKSPKTDLISQEFWDTNLGFQAPNSAILSNSYAKDDSILIKVNIYI